MNPVCGQFDAFCFPPCFESRGGRRMGCHFAVGWLCGWILPKKKRRLPFSEGAPSKFVCVMARSWGRKIQKNIFPRLSYVKQDIADRIYTEHRHRVRKSPIIRHLMQDYRVIPWRVGMGLLGTLYRRIHGRNLGHCFIEVLKSGGSVFSFDCTY